MDHSLIQQAVALSGVAIIFYTLVIRPPRRAEAARYAALMSAAVGDQVVVQEVGIKGTIARMGSVSEPFLVTIAPGVDVEVVQKALAVLPRSSAAEEVQAPENTSPDQEDHIDGASEAP